MAKENSVPPPLDREEDVVDFDGTEDPAHPLNWSLPLKYANPIQSL